MTRYAAGRLHVGENISPVQQLVWLRHGLVYVQRRLQE
jgi:hypothetical protein